ncbi:MAG: LysR family transcriptional regulator [Eubacteriales bacterium]|nr:LysR family transcriptional regulator [Eubacteriales bacterium]
MELRQLRYFLAVADSRSIVSAAESLYISRQAVSKAVCRLEEELGVELFVRDSGGVFLTPTGVLFYERVRAVVKELDSIADQMRTSTERFRLRIRMAFAAGTLLLLEDNLMRYCSQKENLEISCSEHTQEECTRLLQEHQVDLAVGGAASDNPQFVSEELLRSPIGLLLRNQPDLEDMDIIDISDLSWLAVAVLSDAQLLAFCQRHKLSPQYQGQDLYRLFTLTAAGKCALLLPKCMTPREDPRLRWFPLRQEEDWRLYWTYPQIAEANLLFSSALEELHLHLGPAVE